MIESIPIVLTFRKEPEENPCKGLVFRGSASIYFNDTKISEKREVRLLKRKSCTGCANYYSFWEWLSNITLEEDLCLSHIEQGKLYAPVCHVDDPDRESGLVDSWWYEFEDINNDKN